MRKVRWSLLTKLSNNYRRVDADWRGAESKLFELTVRICETRNRSIPDSRVAPFSFENSLLCLCTGKIASLALVTAETRVSVFARPVIVKRRDYGCNLRERFCKSRERPCVQSSARESTSLAVRDFTLDPRYGRISVNVMAKSIWSH